MKILIKILSILGLSTAGTGLGLGMGTNGFDAWEIAISVVGLILTWFLTTKWAVYYAKVKALVHELNDALADDKITVSEIKYIMEAWKSGAIQPDL